MSKAIVLDSHLKEKGSVELPKRYESINSHNLYLYVKHYLSSARANTAKSKNRAEVSGGGRKPWAQKGGGRGQSREHHFACVCGWGCLSWGYE